MQVDKTAAQSQSSMSYKRSLSSLMLDDLPPASKLIRHAAAAGEMMSLIIRSTSKSRPNNIRGGKTVRPYVRPSVHKKFLRFE